jgi:hypothetical protein
VRERGVEPGQGWVGGLDLGGVVEGGADVAGEARGRARSRVTVRRLAMNYQAEPDANPPRRVARGWALPGAAAPQGQVRRAGGGGAAGVHPGNVAPMQNEVM